MDLLDAIRVLSFDMGYFLEKISVEGDENKKIRKRILARLNNFERDYQFLDSWGATTLLELSVYNDFYEMHLEASIKNTSKAHNVYLPSFGKISKIYEESRALYAMTEDDHRILLFSWYEHEVIDRYLIKIHERCYAGSPTYAAWKSIKKNSSLSVKQWTILLFVKQLPIWTLPEEYWWGYSGDVIDLMWFLRVSVEPVFEEGELYMAIKQRGRSPKKVRFEDLV